MKKKAKNGIYTTGKESFKVSILDDNRIVEVDAINEIPPLNLKSGDKTKLNKEAFESFLNKELQHYFWHKE